MGRRKKNRPGRTPPRRRTWTWREYGPRGERSIEFERRILEICERYQRLLCRQVYYRLVSLYDYPNNRNFYRTFDYHLTCMRRERPDLMLKFVDPLRFYLEPPEVYPKVEVWVEKDSLRWLLQPKVFDYGVSVQVVRGFPSLSAIRDAQIRVRDKGVELVLYVGDYDPSGIEIERACRDELGVRFERVALAAEQIRKYGLPSKPVNPRDSRTKRFVRERGNRCYEVEALDPEVLTRELERELRRVIPRGFLREARRRGRVRKIVDRLLQAYAVSLNLLVTELVEAGVEEEEVVRVLSPERLLKSKRGGSSQGIFV